MINLLKAVRVLDEDTTISFTSLYLYAGLLTLALQQVGPETVALLTLIFAHTNLKRFSRYKITQAEKAHEAAQTSKSSESEERLKQIEGQLLQVQNAITATNVFGQFNR